jgi:phage terminase small subunit
VPRTARLTAKQDRFIAEYLIDLNGSAAAVRAGYSPASSRRIAHDLLANPLVMAEVQARQQAQLDKAGITAEGVLEQLRRIAMFDPRSMFDERGNLMHPKDWPATARTCMASFEVIMKNMTSGDGVIDKVAKVKLVDRLAALEMLAKHLGLMTNKVEVDNNITISWLPPEPGPDLPVIDTQATMGPPLGLPSWTPPEPDPQEKTGFPAAAPGSSHTSLPQTFSDAGEKASSAVQEPDELLALSGISRRAQEKMFPELKEKKRV